MKPIEALVEDPIIQLVIFVVLFIGVVDTFRFILDLIWKKLGGKEDDIR